MSERARQWSRRIAWGQGRAVPLDFGQELWKWDVSLYESADGIRASSAAMQVRTGRTLDDDSILFEATRSLVTDVVDAAGGVEQAYNRFCNAVDSIRATYAKWRTAHPDFLPEGGGMVDPSVEAAWYALEELLVWARVLGDRLRRRSVNRNYPADQGLIPALADGPRREAVITARSKLLQGGVSEAGFLSNLSLHMQSSQAGSRSGRVRSGEIVLPFPDRVAAPVGHRWQLTYESGRDAVSFADTLMEAVVHFMEEMISAFEVHLPERFKATD